MEMVWIAGGIDSITVTPDPGDGGGGGDDPWDFPDPTDGGDDNGGGSEGTGGGGGGDVGATVIDTLLHAPDTLITALSNFLHLGLTPYTQTAIDARDDKSNFNRDKPGVVEKTTSDGEKYWVEPDGTFWLDMDHDLHPESHIKAYSDGSAWMTSKSDGNYDVQLK
jgi:hypothetical protein